jgi:hypothetical protein
LQLEQAQPPRPQLRDTRRTNPATDIYLNTNLLARTTSAHQAGQFGDSLTHRPPGGALGAGNEPVRSGAAGPSDPLSTGVDAGTQVFCTGLVSRRRRAPGAR